MDLPEQASDPDDMSGDDSPRDVGGAVDPDDMSGNDTPRDVGEASPPAASGATDRLLGLVMDLVYDIIQKKLGVCEQPCFEFVVEGVIDKFGGLAMQALQEWEMLGIIHCSSDGLIGLMSAES